MCKDIWRLRVRPPRWAQSPMQKHSFYCNHLFVFLFIYIFYRYCCSWGSTLQFNCFLLCGLAVFSEKWQPENLELNFLATHFKTTFYRIFLINKFSFSKYTLINVLKYFSITKKTPFPFYTEFSKLLFCFIYKQEKWQYGIAPDYSPRICMKVTELDPRQAVNIGFICTLQCLLLKRWGTSLKWLF